MRMHLYRMALILSAAALATAAGIGFVLARLPEADIEKLALQATQGRMSADWQLRVAAALGNGAALRARGIGLLRRDDPTATLEGIAVLTAAAQGGHHGAALDLGRWYFLGGIARVPDHAAARPWLTQAARQQPAAAYYLALIANNAPAGHADKALALAHLQQAAAGGIAAAQFLLANAYRDGLGVSSDAAAARHWLQEAAMRDHPGALQALAQAFAHGELGLARDDHQANLLFGLAAEALRDPPVTP